MGRSDEDADEDGAGRRRPTKPTTVTRAIPTAASRRARRRGTLDADGKLQITVPTKVNSKKQDLVYRIEARVTDAGNREIAGHGFALATYGSFFLTAEPDAYVYSKGSIGDHQRFRAGLRQEAGADDVPRGDESLELAQAARARRSPRRKARPTPAARRRSSSPFPMPASFACASSPPRRRSAMSRPPRICGLRATVHGGAAPTQERVQIVADKKTYQPGDTAHVLIVTGKEPASVLVTAEGNGLYSGQVIKSSGGSITVDVPVKPEYAPNFYVAAVFIRGNKLYQGSKSLTVPPTQHEMNVQLLPSKPQYQPGEAASYTIKATRRQRQAGGGGVQPRRGRRGHLRHQAGNRRQHRERLLRHESIRKVSTESSLTYYFSGQAGKRAMQLANVRPSKALAQLKPERLVQPKIRKAFPDTAYWVADVRTGSNGQATVQVRLSRRHHLVARHHARRHARHHGRQRGGEHHRAQEHDGAAGGAALLPARRRDHALDHRAELSAHRQDRASLDGVHRPAGARRRAAETSTSRAADW